jgi:hypothetical protein
MRTQKSKSPKRKPAHIRAAEKERKRAEEARGEAHNAIHYLGMIRSGAHIAELYAKFFPKEFAQDQPDYGDPWTLMGFYDRFTRLVDQKLFPVDPYSDIDMAYEEPEFHLRRIPVGFVRNWLWANQAEDFRYTGHDDHLHIVEKLVVSATDKDQAFHDVDFRLPAGYKFRLPRLHRLCREEKGMIGRLGLVADAILGNTNNVWLDVTDEEYHCCEMPEWTEEQVRFLAREWKEAKFLTKGIGQFFDWCDSERKVERVKRLLRGAQVPEKEEQERIRVRALGSLAALTPQPLVVTLGGLIQR